MFPYQLDDIEIRPLVEREAEIFFTVVEQNRAHLNPWMGWVQRVDSVDSARTFIKNYPNRGGFIAGMWQGNTLIGGMACRYIDTETHESEVGYWLIPEVVGKGLVTRMMKTLVAYLFEEQGVEQIKIQALADNVRSRAVAERLGFTLQGIERGDDGVEDAVYLLSVGDWKSG